MSKKTPTTGPCVYGHGTPTGGCDCTGYKGRRKGVCSCGHERAWHKGAQTQPAAKPMLTPPEKLTWEQVISALRLEGDNITRLEETVRALTRRIEALEGRRDSSGGGGGGRAIQILTDEPRLVPKPRKPAQFIGGADNTPSEGGLPKGERRVLTAIAQSGSGTGASRAFISQMTGYKSRSITDYVTRLRSQGYVSLGWPAFASPSGIAALGPGYAPLPTGSALFTYWTQRLSLGEVRLLEVYVGAYPHAVSHEEVRSRTGYAQRSVTDYATKLLSRRLITKIGHSRRASDLLFDKAKPMPGAS